MFLQTGREYKIKEMTEFKEWLGINNIPTDILPYYKESIVCYKVQAYRSAYLMAYIGFQSTLRNRILNADIKPPLMPDKRWSEIQSKLQDDSVWDETVSECVNMQKPDRVFLITDDIRKLYEGLRTKRNICAHGKSGHIAAVHVEYLWDFIFSYSHLFVINGGKDGIRQMVLEHFDRTLTPPDKDPDYLVNNIDLALAGSSLTEFLEWLYIESQKRDSIAGSCFDKHNKYLKLWDRLYESEGKIRDAVIALIKQDHFDEIVNFIDRYESSIDEFLSDPQICRKLWVTAPVCDGLDNEGAWRILQWIIDKKKVPDNEKDLFNKNLYSTVSEYFPPEHIDILKKTGYFSIFRKKIIDPENYSYATGGINSANWHSRMFSKYIKNFGLDLDSVKSINEIFSFASYGEFFNEIQVLMKDQERLAQYKKICAENGLNDYSEKFEIKKDEG